MEGVETFAGFRGQPGFDGYPGVVGSPGAIAMMKYVSKMVRDGSLIYLHKN
jgi:hypothetical protein